MARIRTIKPEVWTDEKIVECSTTARLLFIGLWNFCDDQGIHQYSPKQIKMEVFPGDNCTSQDIEKYLSELINNGLIKTYHHENKRYLIINGWHHQRIDKPSNKHPLPITFDDYSTNTPRTIGDGPPADSKGRESKGKEGKGKEGNTSAKNQFLDAVFLTDTEHEKLITKYGRDHTERAIEILNNAIMSKGYKYKSHYHTIIGWPMKEANGNGSKGPVVPKTYAQAKDAEKRAMFAIYNQEVSNGNTENDTNGTDKTPGGIPISRQIR